MFACGAIGSGLFFLLLCFATFAVFTTPVEPLLFAGSGGNVALLLVLRWIVSITPLMPLNGAERVVVFAIILGNVLPFLAYL
jgi:hypothetical protein